jgi:protein DGCR14
LTNNDPELLSASIRKLSALAQKKEGQSSRDNNNGRSARQAELDNFGTPYISKPGGSGAARTPLGARGWDTPADIERGDEYDELEGEYGELAGPSRPRQKKKQKSTKPVVRDDLTLDTFQRNYTSEDNASFVQIVQEDNQRRREERWGWAFEAERKAEQRKLEGEERRKMILDTATSGQWRVDANGKRLIGGLAEGGRDRTEGEAWRDERKLIAGLGQTMALRDITVNAESSGGESSTTALVPHSSNGSSGQLILAKDVKRPAESVTEQALPDDHPLNKALVAAGLPGTALVSNEDGQIVPHREVVGGEGEGRGRGQLDRAKRDEIEKAVLGDDRPEHLSLAGSGGDQWGFKVCPTFGIQPHF